MAKRCIRMSEKATLPVPGWTSGTKWEFASTPNRFLEGHSYPGQFTFAHQQKT